MVCYPKGYFNKKTLYKFYGMIKNLNFYDICEERRNELNLIVKYHHKYYSSQTCGPLTMTFFTADKLIYSAKHYGLHNAAELAYFYINMVDPELKFLEIYECANMQQDVKPMCLANFHYYDAYMIHLERLYNERFEDYTPEELWSRESIKLVRAREIEE